MEAWEGASAYRPPRAGTEDGGPWKIVLAVLGRRHTLAVVEAPALAGPVALDTPRWAADMRRDEGRGRNTSTPCASEGVVSKAPGGEPGSAFSFGGNQEISVFGFGGQDGGGYGVGPSREGRKGLHGVFPARGWNIRGQRSGSVFFPWEKSGRGKSLGIWKYPSKLEGLRGALKRRREGGIE